jgi:N-terminal acetyltransferase 2
MFRTSVGPLKTLLLRHATPKRIVGDTTARQISTRGLAATRTPASAPWHHRIATSQVLSQLYAKPKASWRPARLRASWPSPKRQFHASKTRRSQANGEAGKEAGKEAGEKAAEPTTLTARLKKLSREYGWAAVGVYLSLSVLDFPFCFLLVRMVGTERICEKSLAAPGITFPQGTWTN